MVVIFCLRLKNADPTKIDSGEQTWQRPPVTRFFLKKGGRDSVIWSYKRWSMCLRIGKATSESILTTANFHNQAGNSKGFYWYISFALSRMPLFL